MAIEIGVIALPPGTWPWIWKLDVPKKIYFFVRLLFHDFVPTAAMHHKQNVAPYTLYDCYLEVDEGVIHCFCGCNKICSLWDFFSFK